MTTFKVHYETKTKFVWEYSMTIDGIIGPDGDMQFRRADGTHIRVPVKDIITIEREGE